MGRELMPLYYAIVCEFLDGRERSAADVVAELRPDYGGYKLLTLKDVEESLATAKENGLLDESSYELDGDGELVVRFRINDFGAGMIERYLGRYVEERQQVG